MLEIIMYFALCVESPRLDCPHFAYKPSSLQNVFSSYAEVIVSLPVGSDAILEMLNRVLQKPGAQLQGRSDGWWLWCHTTSPLPPLLLTGASVTSHEQ